jgi:hypothetical protein
MGMRQAGTAVGVAALAALGITPVAQAAEPGPPPECEAGCERAFSWELPDNVRFEGWRHVAGGGSFSVLAYYIDGRLHDTTQRPEFEGEGVLSGSCGYDGDAQLRRHVLHGGAQ